MTSIDYSQFREHLAHLVAVQESAHAGRLWVFQVVEEVSVQVTFRAAVVFAMLANHGPFFAEIGDNLFEIRLRGVEILHEIEPLSFLWVNFGTEQEGSALAAIGELLHEAQVVDRDSLTKGKLVKPDHACGITFHHHMILCERQEHPAGDGMPVDNAH